MQGLLLSGAARHDDFFLTMVDFIRRVERKIQVGSTFTSDLNSSQLTAHVLDLASKYQAPFETLAIPPELASDWDWMAVQGEKHQRARKLLNKRRPQYRIYQDLTHRERDRYHMDGRILRRRGVADDWFNDQCSPMEPLDEEPDDYSFY